MPLIDTHCHLDEEDFKHDLHNVLARAEQADVAAMLTIGVTLATSRNAVDLAGRFANVFAVVGVQPNYVAAAASSDWDAIVELAGAPKVVAIGETGLDRYWDYSPIDQQRDWFERHLELSHRLRLPFIVHCRNAENDVIAQLETAERRWGPLVGVMHSFAGDRAAAKACLDLGLHLSFSGMITYRKNDELREAAKLCPLDRLLVETDSPYLAPQPMRGKQNEPSYIKHTAARLADAIGRSFEEVAEATTANARRLFQLPEG